MAVENMEFYIILPKQATNLVVNPSYELATTGYTAVAGSIARIATEQRRGVYSLEVTPNTGVESGVYYGTVSVTSGQEYSFSADVKGVNGQAMRIQVRSTAAAVIKEQTFTGNGYWERPTLTYTESATTTRRLYIVRDAVASTSKYYVDGLQYESGVASTYLDGDMRGFVLGQADYLWTGAPHASTSWRSGGTRSGGTMLRIKDYLKVIGTIGLGMALVSNLATPTSADFSLYQATRINEREINIVGAFSGTTPGAMQANRKTLIDAIKPDLTPTQQPLTLRYQGFTAAGATATEPVDLPVVYESGLEGSFTTPGHERINLQFRQYLPMLGASFESGAVLGYQTSVSDFSRIGYRNSDGVWFSLGSGTNGGVNSLALGPDGSLYAGGDFTLIGGVLANKIAKWNGTTWSALGTGTNGKVFALALGPDGSLYAGGSFTLAGGVAGTAGIAKWNGTVWSPLSSGMNLTGVNALKFGPDGSLYAGGYFSLAGGVAANSIAKWNGVAWSALGTGTNSVTTSLAIGTDGTLYAGGQFTLAGGVGGTNYIAKWNGVAWSALGTGIYSSFAAAVEALAIGPDGSLYAGGIYTQAGGVLANNIARWNGTTWSPLGDGTNGLVKALAFGPDGSLYAGGDFTYAGGFVLPDRIAVWVNGTWTALDVDVQDASAVFNSLALDATGKLYIGGYWTAVTARAATVTVSNIASATAYPTLTFTGPGTLWQVKSYTTGKAVYLKNLTLLAGETATLDLRPGKFSFTSSFRGSLMNYLLPGSSLDFPLPSGNNNISAFMTGTTAASSITMRWTPNYWSVDGAVR